MTIDDVIKIGLPLLCGGAAGALAMAWRGGDTKATVISEIRHLGEKVDGTNTRLDEMKVDAKDHRDATTRHGEDIAALKAQHDLADKLAGAIAHANKAA